MRRHAIAVVVVLAAGLSAAGCTSTGTTGKLAPSAQSTAAAIPSGGAPASAATKASPPVTSAAANVGASGSMFTLADSNGMKATVTPTIVSKTTGAGALAEAPAHGVFEEADIKIAVLAGSYDYNAVNFQFLGSDGNTYSFGDGNVLGAGVDPALTDGTLKAGQSAGGWIAFDVPPGGGTLQLQSDALGGSLAAQWKVAA